MIAKYFVRKESNGDVIVAWAEEIITNSSVELSEEEEIVEVSWKGIKKEDLKEGIYSEDGKFIE